MPEKKLAGAPSVQPARANVSPAKPAPGRSQPSSAGNQLALAKPAPGGGAQGKSNYLAQLRRWLEKHKKYPRRARKRGQQGRTLLVFVMDRNGNVLESKIRESSGSPLLDRAARDMLKRAQPLPKLPSSITGSSLELVVPVEFGLR
ncbi:MAG: energy transducer TonB [Pseudomonadota bacterium]